MLSKTNKSSSTSAPHPYRYYAATCVLLAVLPIFWLTRTDIAGTIAGSVFGGMAITTRTHFKHRSINVLISTFLFLACIFGRYIKLLQFPDWDSSDVQNMAGPALLFATAALNRWLDPKSAAGEVSSIPSKPIQTADPAISSKFSRSSLAVICLCLAIDSSLLLASLTPNYFGMPMFAVSKAISRDLLSFSDKSGLDYALASFTRANVVKVKKLVDGSRKVDLRIQRPALQGSWQNENFSTRKAFQHWLDSNGDQYMVTYSASLSLIPNGLGWIAEWDEPVLSPLQLQKEISTHPAKYQPLPVHPRLNPNLFGIRQFVSGAVGFLASACILLIAGFATSRARSAKPIVAGSLICHSILAAPVMSLYFFG